jgi:ubiquinone/menaquinone biosynthesis C-methylase UbiE
MTIYNNIGNEYNNTRKADQRILDQLEIFLDYRKDLVIADIGAGTGNYSYELASRNYKVCAIEPSDVMIAQGKNQENLTWIKGYAEKIPLNNLSVDAVICTLATHHFTSIELFLSETYRILKKDGILIIYTFDPILTGEDDWLKYHFYELYSKASKTVPRQHELIKIIENIYRNEPLVSNFNLPPDLTDQFFYSGWKTPEKYLDSNFRRGISVFALEDSNLIDTYINKLKIDLHNGIWDKKYSDVRSKSSFNGGYYFIVITNKNGNFA